jgi:hypothetical protein
VKIKGSNLSEFLEAAVARMVHPSLVAEGRGHGSRGNAVGGREAGGEGGGGGGKEAEGADVAQAAEGDVRKALKKKQKVLCVVNKKSSV